MYVIKVGGAEGNEPARIAEDLGSIRPCVIVHGGSAAADALGEALGRPPRFLTSPSGYRSRYTDAETVEVISMAMAGRVNVRLVASLQAHGVPAIGLCGVDGGLLVGRRKTALRSVEEGKVKVVRGDRSGIVERVNGDLLRLLLAGGYVPVVSPPVLDPGAGTPLNADADRIAAAVAAALRADALALLTNVPGFLANPDDPSSLVPSLARSELDGAIARSSGGMKKKLFAAKEALEGGVGRVVIADSRRPRPVRAALAGEGTVIA